jgi:hypothetical protein
MASPALSSRKRWGTVKQKPVFSGTTNVQWTEQETQGS